MMNPHNVRIEYVWRILDGERLVDPTDHMFFDVVPGSMLNYDPNEGRPYFEDREDAYARLSDWLSDNFKTRIDEQFVLIEIAKHFRRL